MYRISLSRTRRRRKRARNEGIDLWLFGRLVHRFTVPNNIGFSTLDLIFFGQGPKSQIGTAPADASSQLMAVARLFGQICLC